MANGVPPLRTKMHHRPKLVNQLADAIQSELLCQRTNTSFIGDKFELIKTKLRFRFTKEEIRDLVLCISQAAVEANEICRVKGRRSTAASKLNGQAFMKDRG